MYVSSSLGIWFAMLILSVNPFNSRPKYARERLARRRNFVYSIAEELRDKRLQGLQMVVQDFKKKMKQVEDILLN